MIFQHGLAIENDFFLKMLVSNGDKIDTIQA